MLFTLCMKGTDKSIGVNGSIYRVACSNFGHPAKTAEFTCQVNIHKKNNFATIVNERSVLKMHSHGDFYFIRSMSTNCYGRVSKLGHVTLFMLEPNSCFAVDWVVESVNMVIQW